MTNSPSGENFSGAELRDVVSHFLPDVTKSEPAFFLTQQESAINPNGRAAANHEAGETSNNDGADTEDRKSVV